MRLAEIQVEILGTFTVCFLTQYARVFSDLHVLSVPLVQAAALFALVLLLRPVAKAHFSPLLSATDLLFRHLPAADFAVLALSQLAGALLAGDAYDLAAGRVEERDK